MTWIRERLKRHRLVHELGISVKRNVMFVKREVQKVAWVRGRDSFVSNYLRENRVRKLHLGAGPMVLDGWINTDLRPRPEKGVVYLDIAEPLPFESASLDFIYSEHLIEHVSLRDGLSHLDECHRVLRPKGVLRLVTPVLDFLLAYFSGCEWTELQEAFMRRVVDSNLPNSGHYHPCILLNFFLRDWGHQFIYSGDLMIECLGRAGFPCVYECEVGESPVETLRGLEMHGVAISNEYNKLQSRAFEAVK